MKSQCTNNSLPFTPFQFLPYLASILLLALSACGDYPIEEEDPSYYNPNQTTYGYGYTNGQRPGLVAPQAPPPGVQGTRPSSPEQQLPGEPQPGGTNVNLHPVDLPVEPEPDPLPTEPILQPPTIDAPAPNGDEDAARNHLVQTALEVYETLDAGSQYPVKAGGTTLSLLVRYPKGTHDTVSDYNSFMCTDFVLYTFTQAGYDLSESGLGSRTTSGMQSAFENKENGDNISFTPQGGDTPPKPGDIAFMQGHVAIITAVDGDTITYTQYNSRSQYSGKLTRSGGGYRIDISYGMTINGWGFYYPR